MRETALVVGFDRFGETTGVGDSVLNRQSALVVVRIRGLIDGKRGYPYSWCGYRAVLGFCYLGFAICLFV